MPPTAIRFILSALCVAWLSLPVAARDLPALFSVTGVAANDVLNIRTEPRASSPIIGFHAPDATGIEVIALSEDGRWGRVNSGEQAGWSAMRFLNREAGPHWQSGEVGLSCFGTEPFWRVDFFLPSSRAEFEGINEGSFELVTDAGTLPSTYWPQTMAIPFSGARNGMAVLRREACNDGMSDMDFGLGLLIYWRGEREGLSGCCVLAP